VAVGIDGTVYSGSDDRTLRVWSGLDGSPVRRLQLDASVTTIAIGAGSTVVIGDGNNRVSAWNGGAAPARAVYKFRTKVEAVAIGQDGRLFVGCDRDDNLYVL
jgi:WD40 repeat protein